MSLGYKNLPSLVSLYMLILLPPSEGKSSPENGQLLKLAELSFSKELGPIRAAQLSKVLDVEKSKPAHEIYSGVLYQSLGWATLPAAAKKRGVKSLIIISAQFGALRINDVIPHYRAKMKTSLWKGSVGAALETLDSNLIVDCRSSTYTGVWIPHPSKTVVVRVFRIDGGKRTVITHMSKKYRGELTRALLLEGTSPKSPRELQQVAAKHFICELTQSSGKNPWTLDLLISSNIAS